MAQLSDSETRLSQDQRGRLEGDLSSRLAGSGAIIGPRGEVERLGPLAYPLAGGGRRSAPTCERREDGGLEFAVFCDDRSGRSFLLIVESTMVIGR